MELHNNMASQRFWDSHSIVAEDISMIPCFWAFPEICKGLYCLSRGLHGPKGEGTVIAQTANPNSHNLEDFSLQHGLSFWVLYSHCRGTGLWMYRHFITYLQSFHQLLQLSFLVLFCNALFYDYFCK